MPTTTVPVLPCLDLEATVEFCEALGFTVSYRQERPYLYLALRLDDVEVNFVEASPGLDRTEEKSGGCLVYVDEPAAWHTRFAGGLRDTVGGVPVAGLPRLTRMRPGQTRFSVVDPSGNVITVIDRREPDIEYGGSRSLSGLAKALDNVRIFRDFKNDDALAARTLDAALRRHGASASRLEVARALADRAELAVVLGDRDTAAALRRDLESLQLTDDQRAQMVPELTALHDIEAWVR